MYDLLKQRFHKVIPNVDFCSLRYLEERTEQLMVRQNIAEPPSRSHDVGVMITVIDKGGLGYAATSDLSETGLHEAISRAQQWAKYTQGKMVTDFSKVIMPHEQGEYRSIIEKTWESLSIADKLDLLHRESAQCQLDDKIVDWQVGLWQVQTEQGYFTNEGGEIRQHNQYLIPGIRVTANQGIETQYRTLGETSCGRQGGLEILDQFGFVGKGQQLAEEALQLLAAPNCPTDKMDLMLAPDQMMLQIHESIGHPVELDRILGDERNYAGTSFVTLDMFGSYQYGSSLLNVTFDPTRPEQFASYGFDDEGLPAQKTYIIRDGILTTPLGGVVSQVRTGLSGVANARATRWNRPPIDRMANLNVEPGDSRIEDMISSIERGIFMRTNASWSIDDSRNKFQFGCEWGQLIEKGKLTQIVKSPNYRGISATFWRNLKKVGNTDTFEVLGVPYCGKGEPNQVIRVGHASPVCVFADVDVFGGA
ncbi:TldD/PmbA family protein [Candidatus Parabeggiatoa sp. HSG14]|uniref:TldD/PmbA family protein n=1 Tax=Candidatus Parabeggiatoa sp. HSG14 TaxID=3055593 RepID=UPI0025A83123|nr:TldD/PmbA family protein [Thiotrichales bacterium HSG14]